MSNMNTTGTKESALISDVSSLMHERVILGAGKGVLFREVSAQFRGVHIAGSTVINHSSSYATVCVCVCVCGAGDSSGEE